MKFAIILFFITFSVLGTEPTYSFKIKNVKKLKRLPVLDDYIEHRKKGVFCDMEFEDVDILIFELSLDVKWPEGKTSFPIKFSTLNIVDDRDETLQHIGEYKKETVYRISSINYSRFTVDKRVRKEKIKQSIIRLAYKLPRDSKSLSCLLSGEKQKILIPKKYSRVSDRPGVKVPLVVKSAKILSRVKKNVPINDEEYPCNFSSENFKILKLKFKNLTRIQKNKKKLFDINAIGVKTSDGSYCTGWKSRDFTLYSTGWTQIFWETTSKRKLKSKTYSYYFLVPKTATKGRLYMNHHPVSKSFKIPQK